MNSYKELKVYAQSYAVAKEVYLATSRFPEEERFGLTSQMKRAATSIPLNIAEGYGKNAGAKELLRFLQMAIGSGNELEVLLSFSKDFGYITEAEYEKLSGENEEVGKMLNGLIRAVKQQLATGN